MNKRISEKTYMLSYYIIPCLFFFGNIKFIKMALTYLGLTSGVTVLATAIFAVLEAILLYCFLHQIISLKKWGLLAVVATINVLYGLPYLIYGMFYQLVQFGIFMVPFTIAAYLIVFTENGLSNFLKCIGNISKIAVWLFFAYLIVLFVCKPGEYGIVEIKEMSYGDIAYAALPFLITDIELFFVSQNKKSQIYSGIRVLIYLSVLIYTGTRSALICMGVAVALQLVRNFSNIKRMGVKKAVCSMLAVLVCVGFCLTVIPAGARLNVIKSNAVYELMGNKLDAIFNPISQSDNQGDKEPSHNTQSDNQGDKEPSHNTQSDNEADDLLEPNLEPQQSKIDFSGYPDSYVYNVKTEQYMDISEAFKYYVVNSDSTISITQKLLQKDIITNKGKYLFVNPKYYVKAAEYTLPMNSRAYLWSTAWNEFMSSPLLGNGLLYYQQKYESTFPHNIVLEIMADFGLVGLIIIGAIVMYFYLYAIYSAHKTSNRQLSQLLAMITMYVPMHLLYHSLYSNGIFIFTVCVLVFYKIYTKKNKQKS